MNIHSSYRFFGNRFRRRRLRGFQELFLGGTCNSILDVGGTPEFWIPLERRPEIVLLNIDVDYRDVPGFKYVEGDGCAMPFDDDEFKIVFSNSTIEHVGSVDRQFAFAREVQRVGRRYYVQTPNRIFPIEPHYLAPGIQFLPSQWQVLMLRYCTLWGWITRPDLETCQRLVRESRLLIMKETHALFTDAEILAGRVLGLTKSLVAVKM